MTCNTNQINLLYLKHKLVNLIELDPNDIIENDYARFIHEASFYGAKERRFTTSWLNALFVLMTKATLYQSGEAPARTNRNIQLW